MRSSKYIRVKGARENNLQNIDVDIPRGQMVVITGVSGSGKSSLAFNTIFAEGQRRYMESLSAYARQFLGRMEKPDVDLIEGLSPAISIDQKGVSKNPRSTVGTITEIYDYLRLLFSRIGKPHCPSCGDPVSKQTNQEIVDRITRLPENKKIMLLAPIVKHMKGEHKNLIDKIKKDGFSRIRLDNEVRDLEEKINLNKNQWHTIEIVVDRLVMKKNMDLSRLSESVEICLKFGTGKLIITDFNNQDIVVSEKLSCGTCDVSIEELEPRNFSFNTPHGACLTCSGLGYKLQIDPELIIPDPNKRLAEGALIPWTLKSGALAWEYNFISSLSNVLGFDIQDRVRDLSSETLATILYGGGGTTYPIQYTSKKGKQRVWNTRFNGIVNILEKRFHSSESSSVRDSIQRYMTKRECAGCSGQRLKKDALFVKISDKNIFELSELSVKDCFQWIDNCQNPDNALLEPSEIKIGEQIFKEISSRLLFLDKVGLGYISLNRPTATLSGGEGQRIRLASQIGSGLTGVMYICDEPSVGLHPVDNHRLIATLQELRNLGNTVIVVEHDEAIMRAADHIIDLGPMAGNNGGHIVAEGSINKIISSKSSLTGQYLAGEKNIELPQSRRKPKSNQQLRVYGAKENNLKSIDISIPLQLLVCITGASGSGKSTLVNEILFKALSKHFNSSKDFPGDFEEIEGLENLDKVINIDQSPIGRTPRSNPATYTGLFGPIRDLFAATPDARTKGYKPGRFSFNVKGGRCESCEGAGYNEIQMQFLPDVNVLCEDCKGKRYNREALEIKFKGQSIAEILNLTVSEALDIFSSFQSIYKKLETLNDVGLGYIKLGQPATTLSGGEAQRVKLSTYLSKRATGKTLFILDEPTTGLSFEDCNALIKILHRLVNAGNSVLLIEHHLDVIKNADWIIDLGPGAGANGGEIMAYGPPEQVAATDSSYTGQFLKRDSKVVPLKTTFLPTPRRKKRKVKADAKTIDFSYPERTSEETIINPGRRSRRFRRRRLASSV
ncbi:MAG: excinuclease ABC subunit A [Dehalococcoidia bacterium]|nr:excinuclease ABC subunit A [Dehalococcoidia bacterium]